ncbi:hypothetical protein EVAR_94719_1 [Eumeta japonica]|uniref:Uncharacterized protein n=1 Tax=Eumeta variegata TaxID=151549 RepID=A0A4C1UW77_EUMVA|nr:hypothetical protein EVAR_94719_1 [Eumeta japonica]
MLSAVGGASAVCVHGMWRIAQVNSTLTNSSTVQRTKLCRSGLAKNDALRRCDIVFVRPARVQEPVTELTTQSWLVLNLKSNSGDQGEWASETMAFSTKCYGGADVSRLYSVRVWYLTGQTPHMAKEALRQEERGREGGLRKTVPTARPRGQKGPTGSRKNTWSHNTGGLDLAADARAA